jgi:hypothetical protein
MLWAYFTSAYSSELSGVALEVFESMLKLVLNTQWGEISGLKWKRVRPGDQTFRSGSNQNAIQELIEKLELSRV